MSVFNVETEIQKFCDSNADTISIGSANKLLVANLGAITAGDQIGLVDGITMAAGKNIETAAVTGTKIGATVSQKIGFWGATPVIQPASASQAAVATTAATSTTPFGYAEAQANAIVTLLNEIRSALITAGIIKGAA